MNRYGWEDGYYTYMCNALFANIAGVRHDPDTEIDTDDRNMWVRKHFPELFKIPHENMFMERLGAPWSKVYLPNGVTYDFMSLFREDTIQAKVGVLMYLRTILEDDYSPKEEGGLEF